jgi:hypothetical protein
MISLAVAPKFTIALLLLENKQLARITLLAHSKNWKQKRVTTTVDSDARLRRMFDAR